MALPHRATIKDVAKAAGVVPSTVSQALNGKRHVDEATKLRVLEAAKALGYRPNPRAQQLRTGGMRSIALVSAMPFGVAAGPSRLGFLMEIAAVAAEAALTRGLGLMLVPPAPSGSNAPLRGLDMDGVLVLEPAARDPALDSLAAGGTPVVCIGQSPTHPHVPCVDLRSEETADLLLQHLWETGARNPALIIGIRERTSYAVTEARYRLFCGERGIEPLIRRVDEEGGEMAGQVATTSLLDIHPEVDGLCALVDAFAVGAVRAAQSRGRKLPEDIRIVTRYDGLRARTINPPLTAVNLHLEEVGALAVELLFAVMSGHETAAMLHPSLPELVVRESSVSSQLLY